MLLYIFLKVLTDEAVTWNGFFFLSMLILFIVGYTVITAVKLLSCSSMTSSSMVHVN